MEPWGVVVSVLGVLTMCTYLGPHYISYLRYKAGLNASLEYRKLELTHLDCTGYLPPKCSHDFHIEEPKDANVD